MPIPNRQRLPCHEAGWLIEITDDGSRTLTRPDGSVSYHSGCGAIAECDVVYLHNSAVFDLPTTQPIRILEVGLGTGMAMLRTLDRAITQQRSIHYTAIEKLPLHSLSLSQLQLGSSLDHPDLADEYVAWWEQAEIDGVADQPLSWDPRPGVSVEVFLLDVNAWQWEPDTDADFFDAIYHDAFDPLTTPELWTEALLARLRACLRLGGRLVTYCVKSEIRKRMERVGFEVRRVPGPVGGKREVMIAVNVSR